MGYQETNILLQTSGFAVGTVLSSLLVILVYCSGGIDRGSRFLFAACILIANSTGLIKNLLLLADPNLGPALEYQVRSIGFAAGALCPCGILLVWRSNAVSRTRRSIGTWLTAYAVLSGIVIAAAVVAAAWGLFRQVSTSGQDAIGNLAIYNGLATILIGGITLLPGTLKSGADRIAVTLMVTGLLISAVSAAAMVAVRPPGMVAHLVQVARFQGILPLVVGAFIYFSHFRAADIFAKWALRLLLAAGLALAGSLALFGPIAGQFHREGLPRASGILSGAAVIFAVSLLFVKLGGWTDLLVERRVFGKRNPREVVQEFRQKMGALDARPAILSLVCAVAAEALAIRPEHVRVSTRAAKLLGTPVEADSVLPCPDADVIIPIPSRDVSAEVAVCLHRSRKTLLTSELDLLNEIALHAGRRLDDLEREEERIERVRMEGQLSRQLIEAELRALRSQINPHFLFNALNTIASLIPSEPEKAEKITLRLSAIFRYVLLHADRPFSSVDEEIEFLRTFLEIEQIRFGDRLAVELAMDPSTAHLTIPSLILQPLVENAIKHGIAPKIGKSRIAVSIRRIGDALQVDVEDDGLGLRAVSGGRPIGSRTRGGERSNTGIGLHNIRERLNTLYGSAAQLTLTDLERGGCRATLGIPIYGAKDANPGIAGG
jgi:two-component system, LytTR family, sensor kinase